MSRSSRSAVRRTLGGPSLSSILRVPESWTLEGDSGRHVCEAESSAPPSGTGGARIVTAGERALSWIADRTRRSSPFDSQASRNISPTAHQLVTFMLVHHS